MENPSLNANFLAHMAAPYPVLLMSHNLEAGGSERQLTEMAKALDRSRFIPHVCCFREGGLREPELRRAGVAVHHLPLTSFHSPAAVRSLLLFGRYIREHGIRLVHTFDVPSTLFGIPAARFYGVRSVLSSQRAFRSLVSPARRHLLRITDGMTDGIVVNSRAVGQDLVERYRVRPARIHVCFNGIDTARFHPAAAGERAGAPLVIGTLGRFRPEKDQASLLEAFARVRRRHTEVKLRLIGGGALEENLRRRSRDLGLGVSCGIEPATADAPSALRSLDIFVLPSLSEALSNSLMEAMACGCCVVASRVGGNPELVSHDETGLLFAPGDVADLAACLDRLIADAPLRARLAQAAAQRIRREFTLPAAAERLAGIYLQTMGAR